MKRKINRQLIGISFVAVVITLLLMTAAFYRIFKAQVMDDLQIYARVISGSDILDRVWQEASGDASLLVRTTVIAPDGKVLYDSNANPGQMDNHLERPEIREAFEYGQGQSIRQSETMKKSTFYYTLRLEDGNVLRVSREAHSIWSILYRSMPVLVIALCALLLLCMGLSHYLTKSLVKPIEHMVADISHIEEDKVYEELLPFARTIRSQHEEILGNASMRQEFTANVSHELKTPLAAISGYSELIENGMASGEDVVRFAAGIRQSAGRLLTLINDTIRLSELDASTGEVIFEEIDLYEMAKDSVEMLQIRAEERDVSLALEGSSCRILGDRQMIEELIYNLCDNAMSYNVAKGRVLVSVKADDTTVVLSVEDTGIGIPKEHQERIFERFYRVDKSRSKSTGGTGLGLAIVKHIVAVHQAEILLISEENRGTKVTITFAI